MDELLKNHLFATHAIAAAGSVTLGAALTHPIDTLKTLIQVSTVPDKKLATTQIFDRIRSLSGNSGLYSGFIWSTFGRIAGVGTRFGIFELLTAFYKDFDDAEGLRERLVREPLGLLKLRELTIAERVKRFPRFKSFFTEKLRLEEKSIASLLARKHCPEVAQCLMQGNVLEKDRLRLSEKYKSKHANDLLKKQYQLRYKLNLVASMAEDRAEARVFELSSRCESLEREIEQHKATATDCLQELKGVQGTLEVERKLHVEDHGKLIVAIQEKDVVQAHLNACKKELAMERKGRRVAEEAIAGLNDDLAAWKSGYDALVEVKDACELTLHRHVRVCEPFFATVFPGQTMDGYMAMVNALKGGDPVVRVDAVALEVADDVETSQRDEVFVEQAIIEPTRVPATNDILVLSDG